MGTRRTKASAAPSEPVEPTQTPPPAEDEVQPCPHGVAPESCSFCQMDGPTTPPTEPEASEPTEPEAIEPTDQPSADAPVTGEGESAATEAEQEEPADEPQVAVVDKVIFEFGDGRELPLDQGEEIIAERVDEGGDLIVVTNFGRKVGISPDGDLTVLTGPALGIAVPATPTPGRKSWKEPRD